MRRIVLLGIAASMSLTAYVQSKNQRNQEKCEVRFAVYQSNPHIPGEMATGMSKEQAKWYEKNKKQYSNVCLDNERPDYVLVWSSRFSSKGAPEPTVIVGSVDVIASTMESEYVYLSIFRAEDFQRTQQDKSFPARPVYYTQHDSWWTYRKSHHKAMDDALKFLMEATRK